MVKQIRQLMEKKVENLVERHAVRSEWISTEVKSKRE